MGDDVSCSACSAWLTDRIWSGTLATLWLARIEIRGYETRRYTCRFGRGNWFRLLGIKPGQAEFKGRHSMSVVNLNHIGQAT
eukprot:scaffold426361_cov18-Prasinocladus_malaysianus.AAC.1